MGIDNARYHGWQGELRSPWWGCLALVRVGLLQIFRRKSYWLLLAVGLLHFLTAWIMIYIATQFKESQFAQQAILSAFSFEATPTAGKENAYVEFMFRQNIIVMALLAFSGSTLVGADFRLRSLAFYLSRRIDRRHYILGKLLSIGTLCAILTVAPALLLFFEYGMFTENFDYWTNNWRIPLAVLGYGFIQCTVMSVWIAAISAYLQNVAPIAIVWASLFVLMAGFAALFVDEDSAWRLLDPLECMRYAGRLCFGTFESAREAKIARWAIGILAATCVVALAALTHRVRAVDIVE
jgi:hypothetical protein